MALFSYLKLLKIDFYFSLPEIAVLFNINLKMTFVNFSVCVCIKCRNLAVRKPLKLRAEDTILHNNFLTQDFLLTEY